jgi:hypothetical protein
VDPRAGLDDVEKILDLIGTRPPNPSVVQPIASRSTDCAIPAPHIFHCKCQKWRFFIHITRCLAVSGDADVAVVLQGLATKFATFK